MLNGRIHVDVVRANRSSVREIEDETIESVLRCAIAIAIAISIVSSPAHGMLFPPPTIREALSRRRQGAYDTAALARATPIECPAKGGFASALALGPWRHVAVPCSHYVWPLPHRPAETVELLIQTACHLPHRTVHIV